MSDSWYYNFMNMESAVQRCLVKGTLPYDIRYLKDIVSTRVSMFKYKNIEKIKGLTSEILETALMFSSHLCFYKSVALGGWVLCRYVTGSEFSYYLRPTKVNLLAFNGETIATDVPYEDIILVKDNSMDIIPFICVNEYILYIKKIENSLLKVLDVASLPLALVGTKIMASQLKAIATKLGNSDPYIVGDDTLIDTVKGFGINVPVNPLDIYDLKSKYRNEFFSSLGIYSVDEKRERIVTQELVNQNDYTDFVYQDAKLQRQYFVDMLNKLDPSLNIELIESYDVNVKETIEDDAYKAKEIAKAENIANKENNNGRE